MDTNCRPSSSFSVSISTRKIIEDSCVVYNMIVEPFYLCVYVDCTIRCGVTSAKFKISIYCNQNLLEGALYRFIKLAKKDRQVSKIRVAFYSFTLMPYHHILQFRDYNGRVVHSFYYSFSNGVTSC